MEFSDRGMCPELSPEFCVTFDEIFLLYTRTFNQQTKGIKSARTVDFKYTTGTQQQRPESPTMTPGVYVSYINVMSCGVIVEVSGLCCCVPVVRVPSLLL